SKSRTRRGPRDHGAPADRGHLQSQRPARLARQRQSGGARSGRALTARSPVRKVVSMQKAEIPFLSAAALGELIRKREVSPVEATEAYLERIAAIDSRLHSYITVCREVAVQAAREAEQALARGEYRGPLHGVPVAVKDQF